ncbi:MAG TPA: diguanylate cyclase [Acidimicrobiales bacterium]|nr:diguanylate cyclase [Acidimicrobiales bacterium]
MILLVLGAATIALAVLVWRERTHLTAATNREHSLQARVDELEHESAAATLAAADIHPSEADLAEVEELDGDLSSNLTDGATGLFNEQFFRVTLDTRVSAARRHLRPVAVVLVQVSQGVREGSPLPVAPDLVAEGVRATLRDADTACRLDDGRFALILEDTPENGAVWTVERVRRALAIAQPGQTLWAGIACYPAHAFDAWELFDRAARALEAAREWHQDRIEVATAD